MEAWRSLRSPNHQAETAAREWAVGPQNMRSLRFRIRRFRLHLVRTLERDVDGVLPLRVAAIAVLVVLPLLSSCMNRQAPLVFTPLSPEDAVVDLRQDAGAPVRRGIPPKPPDWQKV